MAGGPGIVPKVVVTGARVANYPFTIPSQMTTSASKIAEVTHTAIPAINGAVRQAYEGLDPRGPAKWLLKLFDKVDEANTRSMGIADRNTKVFWGPFSEGMSQIGQAVGGPGAYYYAKKAGYADPAAEIKNILSTWKFPTPAGGGAVDEPAPAPQPTPTPGGDEPVPGGSTAPAGSQPMLPEPGPAAPAPSTGGSSPPLALPA